MALSYQPTDYSYVCNYKDGAWEEGGLTTDHTLTLSECAGIFHYCQEVFEGLKAYTTKDGDIVCFRPDLNASRMADSARRIVMPPFPEDKFVEAVKDGRASANEAWVPPFGSGATLYVRPFMVATGEVIGVAPATEYQFRILVTPVGPYYSGGVKPVAVQRARVRSRRRRTEPATIKAGLNYAMSPLPERPGARARASRTTCTSTRRPTPSWRSPAAPTSCSSTRTARSWCRKSAHGLHPAVHHAPQPRARWREEMLGMTVVERPVEVRGGRLRAPSSSAACAAPRP